MQSGTPATDVRIGPLASHQLAMPSKNGVGCDDARHLPEHPTPKPMPQFGEASPLRIIEAQSPPVESRFEDAVLFSQERDDGVLLTSKPTAQRQDQELKRKHVRSLCQRSSIRFWDSTGSPMRRYITQYEYACGLGRNARSSRSGPDSCD
jgi:hypothetical protein